MAEQFIQPGRVGGLHQGTQVVQFASADSNGRENDQNLGGSGFPNIHFKQSERNKQQEVFDCLFGGKNRKRSKKIETFHCYDQPCSSRDKEHAESSDTVKDEALNLVKAANIHLKARHGKLQQPVVLIFNENFSGNVPEFESQLVSEMTTGTIVRKFRDVRSGKQLVCKALLDAVEINEIQIPLELKNCSYVTQLFGIHWDGIFLKLIQEDAGGNLHCVWHELREKKGPQFVLYIMLDLCEGLNFLHRHGIIHRDVKPENLCVSYCPIKKRFFAKLIDFGSCKVRQDGHPYDFNPNDEYKGLTPEYLPPDFNAFFFKQRSPHEKGKKIAYPSLGPSDDMYAAGLVGTYTHWLVHPMMNYHEGISNYPLDTKEAKKVRGRVLEKIGEMNGLESLPDVFLEYPECPDMVQLLKNLLMLDKTKRLTAQQAVDYVIELLQPCGPPKKFKLAPVIPEGCSTQSETSSIIKLKLKKGPKVPREVAYSAAQDKGYSDVDMANKFQYRKGNNCQMDSAELRQVFKDIRIGSSGRQEGHVYQDNMRNGTLNGQQEDVSKEEYDDLVLSFSAGPASTSSTPRPGTARCMPGITEERYPERNEAPRCINGSASGGGNIPLLDQLLTDVGCASVVNRRARRQDKQ